MVIRISSTKKKNNETNVQILITGGAGCLGANLVEHLVPAGHEILVIDNFATGYCEALPSIVPVIKPVFRSMLRPAGKPVAV